MACVQPYTGYGHYYLSHQKTQRALLEHSSLFEAHRSSEDTYTQCPRSPLSQRIVVVRVCYFRRPRQPVRKTPHQRLHNSRTGVFKARTPLATQPGSSAARTHIRSARAGVDVISTVTIPCFEVQNSGICDHIHGGVYEPLEIRNESRVHT